MKIHAYTQDGEPTHTEVKEIIKSWYERLSFPKCCDSAFAGALEKEKISDNITVSGYDKSCENGKRNLLSYLFMCEQTKALYAEKGIPDSILYNTLSDIVTWTKEWSRVKGELALHELTWLENHLTGKLYRLGRLQFRMGKSTHDAPEYGIKKGDNVLEVHIPSDSGRLDIEECKKSFAAAREFFKKYFPDFEYGHVTCHSWLLDRTLEKYLPEDSNIIRFGRLFTPIHSNDSYALLKYLFHADTNEVSVRYAIPTSTLAAKVQNAVLSGEGFCETLGLLNIE